MCTIGAISRGDKTFLIKNFDYLPKTSLAWAHFQPFGSPFPHFALVDHFQQGINSGLNIRGLGLVIAESDPDFWEGKKKELRTVINAEILAKCKNVKQALIKLRKFASAHPEMIGGNFILGDHSHIAVIESLKRKFVFDTVENGFFARANQSVFGLRNDWDNFEVSNIDRYEKMESFLKRLFTELPNLNREEIIRRCKNRLRTRPIFNKFTLSSMIMDIQKRRIEFKIGNRRWQTFQLNK